MLFKHCLKVQIAVKRFALFINSYSPPSNNSHGSEEIVCDNLVWTVFGTCIKQYFALSNFMSAIISFTCYFCLTLNVSFIQSLPFFFLYRNTPVAVILSLPCLSFYFAPFPFFLSKFSFFFPTNFTGDKDVTLFILQRALRVKETERGHSSHLFF